MTPDLWRYISVILLVVGLANGSSESSKTSQSLARSNAVDTLTNKKCKGSLDPPCVCNEFVVKCVNVQFTDSDVFLIIGSAWTFLKEVTFIGNNFQVLPSSLFGKIRHNRLHKLNLTSNYIVQLDHRPFEGMPNLQVLDLSYNEVILNENDTDFLADIRQLRRLVLRNAFSRPPSRSSKLESNRSQVQSELLEKSLRLGRLEYLKELDLSYNFLRTVHYNLVCSLPGLNRLDLSNNVLNTFNINSSCLSSLTDVDLSGNSLKQIDMSLRILAQSLPDFSLRLGRNSFHCNCESVSYIEWVRKTYKVADKDRMKCYRASPTHLQRVALLDLNLTQLDCSIVLDHAGANTQSVITILTAFIIALNLL